jgi:hypothetical protein
LKKQASLTAIPVVAKTPVITIKSFIVVVVKGVAEVKFLELGRRLGVCSNK